jgi:hypothetical protein
LWAYLCQLNIAYVALSNESAQLKGELHNKTVEITNLRQELADISSLRHQIEILEKSNAALISEINELRADNAMLHKQMVVLASDNVKILKDLGALRNTLNARQIGMDADINVTDFIFPKCRSKPFRIRSYKNLIRFVKNPAEASRLDLCDENAPAAWDKMDEPAKENIKHRLMQIQTQFADLKDAIDDLKGQWGVAHPNCSHYDEVISYFHNNNADDIVSALQICKPIYQKDGLHVDSCASELDK